MKRKIDINGEVFTIEKFTDGYTLQRGSGGYGVWFYIELDSDKELTIDEINEVVAKETGDVSDYEEKDLGTWVEQVGDLVFVYVDDDRIYRTKEEIEELEARNKEEDDEY